MQGERVVWRLKAKRFTFPGLCFPMRVRSSKAEAGAGAFSSPADVYSQGRV